MEAWAAIRRHRPQIRALLAERPTMPARVIAERVGRSHSLTVVKDRVRVPRPFPIPLDPASCTTYQPWELMLWDLWFTPVDGPLGAGHLVRPPVLVMVSGYSRWISAVPEDYDPEGVAALRNWSRHLARSSLARRSRWVLARDRSGGHGES